MITQSGCFGSNKPIDEQIDTVEEVSTVVDDIMGTDTNPEGSQQDAAAYVTAVYCAALENRIRMLTWAVVAIVVVLIIREM